MSGRALRNTRRSAVVECCEAHLVDAELHTRDAGGVECCEAHGDRALVALARRQHGVVTTTGAVHVTVTGRQPRPRPGLRIHRSHSLNAAVKQGLPLTTPPRTLIDLAPHLPQHELDRATEQVQILGLASRTEIAAQLSNRRGARALHAALHDEPTLTRSEAERRLLDLIRKAGLPRPQTNVKIAGYEVDLLWRQQRLIVEVDGYAFHSGRAAFERDRRRDAALQAAGYRVVRFTWRQITRESHAVVAVLATLLRP